MVQDLVSDRLASRKITTLNMHTTYSCNYACGMCPFHGEGYSNDYFNERISLKKELNLLEVELILRQALEFGIKKIDLTPNGEFFSTKNWEQILRMIKGFGFEIYITTNGGLLTENIIKTIAQIKIKHIAVSIDSIDYDIYKVIRKPATRQAYENAINAPILLKKYCDSETYIQVQITEQPQYGDEVWKLLDFYKKFKFNQISVNKVFETTDTGISHYNVEPSVDYVHGTCKAYGNPIVMTDGTIVPCCGAFYFYQKMQDMFPNIYETVLSTAMSQLDQLYLTNKLFIDYCEKCSLFESSENVVRMKNVYGRYYVEHSSTSSRYYHIPYGLHIFPSSIILWMYKNNFISRLKRFFNYGSKC